MASLAALTTALTTAPAIPAAAGTVAAGPRADTDVIVAYTDAAAAERAVAAVGGTTTRRLDLVDSIAATVPASGLRGLATASGVRTVTPDGSVRLKAARWRADTDENSLYSIEAGNGAQRVWTMKDAAGRTVTGKGVGVALIDSGISPVEGLNAPGKVVNGPDLSLEAPAVVTRHLDTFGHGTHMAGIIAGRDTAVRAGYESDPRNFTGVAPDATLINVKVAAADGAVDVSQVIAAIDWVVAHRNDAGLNIRVLNLSFGTDSAQDPRLDPLSHAVEAAWRLGIVVVVAVGNDGPTATRVSMPAANPYVIAVGGADPRGTAVRTDDIVGDFSTRGSATRHADLLAAGKSVVSLRVPGSYIDINYPTGRLPSDPAQRLFRGSGTSQATAVVSGAAALLLQQRPTLTPDQVKRLLMTTTDKMPTADPISAGEGQLNIAAAAAAPTPAYVQTWPASRGTGTLEGARGSAHIADPVTGVELRGERDIMGSSWNPGVWSAAALTARTWSGGVWNGRTWSGSSWSGYSWTSRTWSSALWTGTTWTGALWSSRTWSDAVWDGRTWSARTWSARTWSARTWSGSCWT
ncbi:S8 family serine peptidase [Virgisporangium ochraceum]|uniref:S8 family serine peptidase n=1 Tax=Virgisporangium ochraceum TaxID=65505 RepID=UPI001EF23005|nr:S8 family serine peptidase [Virgisporangium ochraceum]